MAGSSLVITLNSAREEADLARFIKSSSDPRGQAKVLQQYFERIASGTEGAGWDIQTGDVAPVAASGTWTCASVIATDEAVLAGVTLAFTASPSLETDVLVTVPSAKAFASSTDLNLAGGTITETAHGYVTGDVGQLTTSSSLPTGFSLSTNYFVIKQSADKYKLASSKANALAGIAIIPTGLGVGNQTFTLTVNSWVAKSLCDAVNAHSLLSKLVVATCAAGVVTVTALQKGIIGNQIAFTDNDSTITSSGSGFLAGGLGGAKSATVHYSRGL